MTSGSQVRIAPVISGEDLIEFQELVQSAPVSDQVLGYAWALGRASRPGKKESADFVDRWVEWGAGPRGLTALIMAASLFALKLGFTFGGAIVGWTLAYYGFAANQAQTPEAMQGILLLISVLPAIAGIFGGALMIVYPLNNKMMIKIEEELTTRRKESERI